ncbi:hypothetical protein [Streptomyces shenzhenensis]|uniref:hypothetical protein n=1 Tax=Streptomyces shenzhenensis TaxID=943815 RepID=UPI001F2457BF|nr:hypothetical protein [Streptomyces shenzhenensis]
MARRHDTVIHCSRPAATTRFWAVGQDRPQLQAEADADQLAEDHTARWRWVMLTTGFDDALVAWPAHPAEADY